MQENVITHSLWTEKHRPHKLADYIGNENLKETVQRYIDQDDIPHLLLHARAGTGKTTLGKIITNTIDCDVLYINASDENNVDTIRTKIKSFVSSVGFKKWKIVFLDEADYLTPNAQAVLRNMMEQYSRKSRFILTCNYPEKIIDPIQSRCTVFEVYPPSKKDVAIRLVDILKQENVQFDMKDVGIIINNSYPDIRRVIGSTQRQIVNGELKLTKQSVMEVDYMNKILDVLKSKSTSKDMFTNIRQIVADSKVRTFDDLYRFLYDNIEQYAKEGTQAAIILEIAKTMREDAMCVDKEISIMAMFIGIISHLK
jgi:DNA polymerase III delta prime subunit